MDDPFEQLWTTSFDDYLVALTAVRERLEGGEHRTLGDADPLRVRRPFLVSGHPDKATERAPGRRP